MTWEIYISFESNFVSLGISEPIHYPYQLVPIHWKVG
jgi:hypothetical protein